MIIAGLIFVSMAGMLLGKQSVPGGDYGVGYAWTLILGNGAFTICITIAVAIIGQQGGFSWVASTGANRTLLVSAGYILAILGYNFFAMKEGLQGLSKPVRELVDYAPGVTAVLMLLVSAILLNEQFRIAVPPLVYKIPILFLLGMGCFAFSLIMAHEARNTAARVKYEDDFSRRIHQNHLDQIDSTDVNTAMCNILVFTDANHAKDVRERALDKIRSRPDWQQEMVRFMDTNCAPEAFTFLASNEVEDKSLFLQPLETGIRVQAQLIRASIRHCRDTYDLYSGRFVWEVERVLRTVKKFEDMGVDYVPAIQELRNAMNEHTSFEKPKLVCIPVLDRWLKTHQPK